MDDDLIKLHKDLRRLHEVLRAKTKETYGRINPFVEDLFDWKERGAFWSGSDKNITIYNSATVVGDVSIGKNSWIGPNCALDGSGGLHIGEYCSISSGVQIVTHDTVKWALSGGRFHKESAPVRIGDCCYIGSHAIIIKGVTVGNHCLVAAGAVVVRDVPSYSIVAGVPARTIGHVVVEPDGNVNLRFGNLKGKA